MPPRFSPVRASLFSVHAALAKLDPHGAEVARLQLLLETDELWESASPNASSGSHALSIRFRPSRFPSLSSPTGRATLISLLIGLAQWGLNQYASVTGEPVHLERHHETSDE